MRRASEAVRLARRAALIAALGASACGGDGRAPGLEATPASAGPRIVWDLYAKPVAEIPFPNDVAAIFDERSPTERRLNLSLDAPTRLERRIRGHFNELDGFGTFAPITLSFDAPLDLSTVSENSVHVVNIDPGSSHYGEAVPLDLGRGYFPVRDDPSQFFPFDPDADQPGYLLPGDNVADRDGDGRPELVDFYEVATDTLLIRPAVPLQQASRYAVVLTDGLRGANGEPVRSPFGAVHHLDQTEDLGAALPVLAAAGAPLDRWAFAWVFTTQSVTSFLETVRRGLDGEGVLARLAGRFPPRLAEIEDLEITTDGDGSLRLLGIPRDDGDNPFILQSEFLQPIIDAAESLSGQGAGDFPNLGVDGVDYFVFGSFDSPSFLDTADGVIALDPTTGEGPLGVDRVTFFLSVPRETERHRPPFPVLLYAHGSNTARVEAIGFANTMARFGISVAGIDAVGHGPFDAIADLKLDAEAQLADLPVPPGLVVGLLGILTGIDLGAAGGIEDTVAALFDVGVIEALAETGRAPDVDGDGTTDSGFGFFRANSFETRDTIRQTVVDQMQFLRVLRGFGADRRFDYDGDGVLDLDGDFDADGRLDVGGPDLPYRMAGTSLGGFLTTITLAVEPGLEAGAPIVPGGGLSDVIARSRLRRVTQDIFLQVIGPVVVGCPAGPGRVAVTMNNDAALEPGGDGCQEEAIAAATLAELPARPGARVEVVNRVNGERAEGTMGERGGFAVGIAADVGDVLGVRLLGADGSTVEVSLRSPHEGLGFRRNTPDVRRFAGLAQIVLDPADPINYAPHLFLDPLPGVPPKPVLQSSVPGDMTVPMNTQVALARAAGLLGPLAEALERSDELVRRGVLLPEGEVPRDELFDVDDLDRDNGGPGPYPTVASGAGRSAVRFPLGAKHEYIGFSTPDAPVDWAIWSQNQIGLYVSTSGREVVDDLCLEDSSCSFVPPIP